MRLTRPDDELSQGRKGSEWLGQHNGEIGLQDFVFLLSYRKAAGLNFCASCDFRATHPKPLPGLLSPWCLYSVRPWRWKRLGAGLVALGSLCSQVVFHSGCCWNKSANDRRGKPLPRCVCRLQNMSVWLLLCGRELALATLSLSSSLQDRICCWKLCWEECNFIISSLTQWCKFLEMLSSVHLFCGRVKFFTHNIN